MNIAIVPAKELRHAKRRPAATLTYACHHAGSVHVGMLLRAAYRS